MAVTTDCPSDEALKLYLAGRTTESEASAIGQHVERCADCVACLEPILASLRASDRVMLTEGEQELLPKELERRMQELGMTLAAHNSRGEERDQ